MTDVADVADVTDVAGVSHVSHALHGGERLWTESNCYVDLWIELLHAWGHEPLAALGFTVRMDLEGDQWTFFKFRHADLEDLFGVEVLELNVWRPLVEHCATEVGRGHAVLVEVDAFHLPDTAGISYGLQHVKTTIGIDEIDVPGRRLAYYHGTGRHELAGADFEGALRVDASRFGPDHLAPYVELARRGPLPALAGAALAERAADLLRHHLARVPPKNPVARYRERIGAELAMLPALGPDAFHGYSFANCRQLGANFELAADHLYWLAGHGGGAPFLGAAEPFRTIARDAKALQFTLARAVLAGRRVDVDPLLVSMESAWTEAVDRLVAAAG